MAKKPLTEIARRRKKLALEFAEIAERYFLSEHKRDVDELAREFEIGLPFTYDEAMKEQAEFDKTMSQAVAKQEKPSLLDRLRQSLGLENEHGLSLRCIMETAIERLNAQRVTTN